MNPNHPDHHIYLFRIHPLFNGYNNNNYILPFPTKNKIKTFRLLVKFALIYDKIGIQTISNAYYSLNESECQYSVINVIDWNEKHKMWATPSGGNYLINLFWKWIE